MRAGWVKENAKRWVGKRFGARRRPDARAKAGLLSRASLANSDRADATIDGRKRDKSKANNAWAPCDLRELDPKALGFVMVIVERLISEGYVDQARDVLREMDAGRLSESQRERFSTLLAVTDGFLEVTGAETPKER